jgi:hypothetical protein
MKLSQNYLKDSLSSLSPKGDREPRFDLKYPGFIYKKFFSSQATSLKLQAGGWDPKGTSTRGGWAHSSQATYPQVIHRKDI